jgi:hypothetical protein
MSDTQIEVKEHRFNCVSTFYSSRVFNDEYRCHFNGTLPIELHFHMLVSNKETKQNKVEIISEILLCPTLHNEVTTQATTTKNYVNQSTCSLTDY